MSSQAPTFAQDSRSSSMPQAIPVVFVVDDDISVRESLELLIRFAGWQAELFASAQEFLAHPRPAVPSCLVLDVNLPGLNGLDLQRRIAGERADMPIIFITGYGDVPRTVQAMKAGAVEFLTKPFKQLWREVRACHYPKAVALALPPHKSGIETNSLGNDSHQSCAGDNDQGRSTSARPHRSAKKPIVTSAA